MKILIIFAFLIGASIAQRRGFQNQARATGFQNYQPPTQKLFAPPPQGRSASTGDATILNKNFQNTGSNYNFDFETSDGTKRFEEGEIKKIGDTEGIVMRGEYSYVGPDGNTYRVSYIADEKGFRPTGDHIQVGA